MTSHAWVKSSFSVSGNCVEVARDGDTVRVRDTKATGMPLALTLAEWGAFLAGVHAGEFDRLGQGGGDLHESSFVRARGCGRGGVRAGGAADLLPHLTTRGPGLAIPLKGDQSRAATQPNGRA